MAILLTTREILTSGVPLSDIRLICGVYFLIENEVVIYIGQSVDIAQRVLTHARTGLQFDRWAHIPCERSDLNAVERAYLDAISPRQNRDSITRRNRGERHVSLGTTRSGMHVSTPNGIFTSVMAAAQAHGITKQAVYNRLGSAKTWRFIAPNVQWR